MLINAAASPHATAITIKSQATEQSKMGHKRGTLSGKSARRSGRPRDPTATLTIKHK